MLAEWPVACPRDWLARVQRAQSKREEEALRRAIDRGQPFGSETWVDCVAKQLGLESSLRPRGRPRKKVEWQLVCCFFPRLPSMLSTTATMQATAADDLAVSAQRQAQRAGSESMQRHATACERELAIGVADDSVKSLCLTEFCECVPADAAAGESAPPGTRTQNPLIKSQML